MALDGVLMEGVNIRVRRPNDYNAALAEMKRAYYALCTHLDHQLRVVLGTLREEKELDNTIILFSSDHGEMLGDFGLYAKRTFYEGSAHVPMILMGRPKDKRILPGTCDDRLVGLQDVMPTLLDLAGIDVPETCDGISMLGDARRDLLYGDVLENTSASRMIHDGRYKLIWYPAGNILQLFDLETDPGETTDVAADAGLRPVRDRLVAALASACYGKDVEDSWVRNGQLVGYDPGPYRSKPDRSFSAQRGMHYPPPPSGTVADDVGFPE
jgi:arylsulfatase A-like enzyme